MRHARRPTGLALAIAAALAATIAPSLAQPTRPSANAAAPGANTALPQNPQKYASPAEILLETPVSGLHPGGVDIVPKITNPAIGNPPRSGAGCNSSPRSTVSAVMRPMPAAAWGFR